MRRTSLPGSCGRGFKRVRNVARCPKLKVQLYIIVGKFANSYKTSAQFYDMKAAVNPIKKTSDSNFQRNTFLRFSHAQFVYIDWLKQ